MAAPVRGHNHSIAGVPRKRAVVPHPGGVRWPEKWCYGSCLAAGRVAGWCFTSAVPATGGIATAGTGAERKQGGNSGGGPTSDTSKAGRDGSITADRQRAYRERRRRRRVTDHTSAGKGRSVKIVEPVRETRRSTPLAEELQDRPRFEWLPSAIRPVCILCGRGGRVGVKRIGPERQQS